MATGRNHIDEGLELLGKNNLVGAREKFEAALADRPNDVVALAKLGAIAGMLGDLAQSEAMYQRLLAIQPDSGEAHSELGLLAWRRYDDAEAVRMLAPVCRAKPESFRMASYLAEAYAGLGQDAAIVELFTATLRANHTLTAEALMPFASEVNVVPACRKALFQAAARVAGAPAAEWLLRRADSDAPLEAAGVPEPWRSLVALPRPKTISACMIVKNESLMLGRLLASVKPMVDEIIVVDTGSTDDTVAIAESYGARIFHFDWIDDFGAARNESLKHATGDWILLVDADSEMDLASRRGLRRFLQRPSEENGKQLTYAIQLVDHRAADETVVSSRTHFLAIFPNDPDLRYVGAIHEQLTDFRDPPRERIARPLNDVICHHYGYAKVVVARQGKKDRNMRILLKELEERPDDAFVRFNIAQQLRIEGDLKGGVEHVRVCLGLCKARGEDFRPAYLEPAHILHADLLERQGAYPALLQACEDGLKAFPNCFDLLGRLGLARLATNKTDAAIEPLEAALRRKGTIGASGSNADFTGWISETLLAIARWRLGDAEGCDRHLRHAWDGCTDRQAMANHVVHFCGVLLGSLSAAPALLGRIGVKLNIDVKKAPATSAAAR